MKISLNFLVRIIGMCVLAYVGNTVGRVLSAPTPDPNEVLATQLLTLAGAGLGLLTTHRWTIEPLQDWVRYLRGISIAELTAISFGMLIGLVFAVLLAVPLSHLPAPFGQIAPIVTSIALAYLGSAVFAARKKEIGELLRSTRQTPLVLPQQLLAGAAAPRRYILDTSAIIDGRIAGVCQAGFLEGTLLVPHFVLHELQMLADSSEELRRGKGKRGLEILSTIQKNDQATVEIISVEVPDSQQVDEKLVVLARQYRCPIITNDYNLGRVAELQGVKGLNLN
ncbi:MAG: twitching motility protein PilT, partial [Chloroflexota bacterium]